MADKQDSIMVDGVEWFVGDKVKVVQKVDSRHPTGHCGKEWADAWVTSMDKVVGSTSYIMKFCGAGGILLTSGIFSYPSSSLQNISAEQREAEKKAKEQTVKTKKESIVVNGVEWHIGDRVVWADYYISNTVYNISEFRGDNIVLFEGYPYEYSTTSKVFVNVSAIGREQEKEVAIAPAPAPTIGGIELKPWMRVEIKRGEKYVVCFGMDSKRYPDEGVFLVNEEGFLKVSSTTKDDHWEAVAVYAAPDYPTLTAKAHGPLLWSKADDEAKKEAEAKKKAIEEAEAEYEAAKQRYNEAYAKLVAIAD